MDLFGIQDLKIEKLVFVAENPIKEPVLNENGILLHNIHFLNDKKLFRWAKKFDFQYLPFWPYLLEKYYSNKYHYLTDDGADANVRQVMVQFRKTR